MRILVTGGSGFIGSNLVRFLLRETDHSVINIDKLTYAAHPQSLVDVANSPRYIFRRVDITDAAALRDVFAQLQPEAVMHLAAESHVDRSIDGPATFVQTNLVGTFQLLDACCGYLQASPPSVRTAFRLVHVSTDEVYGSLSETGLFAETSRYAPRSPYAATKAGADHLARAWQATFDLPVIVTNCSNNYGPYQFPEKLIPLMIIRALRGESLPVYGLGLNVRDWLYVQDHVRGLKLVLEQGRPGESYNLGGNCERRNIDLIGEICRILDEVQPRASGASYCELIRHVADRPGHDYRYALDSTKIRRELGWQPVGSLASCLRQTVAWYLDNRAWWQSILDGHYQLQRLGSPPLVQPGSGATS